MLDLGKEANMPVRIRKPPDWAEGPLWEHSAAIVEDLREQGYSPNTIYSKLWVARLNSELRTLSSSWRFKICVTAAPRRRRLRWQWRVVGACESRDSAGRRTPF